MWKHRTSKIVNQSLPLLAKAGSIRVKLCFSTGVGGLKWAHAIMTNHALYCTILLPVGWVEYNK